ncbi:MAG: RTX toxin [Acidobacteriota bacterium]
MNSSTRRLPILLAAALAIVLTLPATAQLPNPFNGKWVAQGPAPIVGAQVENVFPNNEVSGAIHTVAAHPTDPDVLLVGTVNGGIWRTQNATAAQPTWKNVTSNTVSLSIGALEFDPTDSRAKKMIAGIGRWSSFARVGGERIGLLYSKNRGKKWKVVDGGGLLVGKNISGVAARGNTYVAAVNIADVFSFGNIGIFRSTNKGATFTQISGAAGTGLPLGTTYDLVGDPNDTDVLYTAVVFANLAGQQNGVYRSDDIGATWTKVSNAAIDAQLDVIVGTNSNVELAVGDQDNVYVAIANNDELTGVFRSGNAGGTWTQMDLPGTVENGGFIGIHPGNQGNIHMSIVADPTDANVVYIGGDRQPQFNEGLALPQSFPNSIGAGTFSGRLFRGDASQPAGSQWVHLTHSNALGAAGGGTASSSSPHADSREMVFDAAGDLIETDDGGVYRRTSPGDNTGDWFSLNGNLQVTEIHDHAFDNVSNVLFSGNQDNGTTIQTAPGRLAWSLLLSGDGGDAAADDTTLAAFGQSIRYSSAQGLQAFVVTFWDTANNLLGFFFPPLTVINGGAPIQPQFTTPFEPNAVDGSRILIAGANSLYESLDQGNTLTEAGPGVFAVGDGRDPIAYGAPDNPDIIYSGNFDRVVVRTGAPGTPLVDRPTFPAAGSGSTIRDIVIDPDDSNTAYVINAFNVFVTTDAGLTWTDITAGLIAAGADTDFRALTYVPRVDGGSTDDLLVLGASNGVFGATESAGFTNWGELGSGIPSLVVYDLDFDAATQTLSAGTMGRGAFTAVDIVYDRAPVRPVLECVDDNGDGTFTAHFGYKNDNPIVVTVPIGNENKFSPSPQDRGQTTLFQPGRQVDVFTVDFNGSNLVWTLAGRTSTASSNSSRCN